MKTGVRLPTSRSEGKQMFGKEKKWTLNNLPCPKVHDIGGHASMKMLDILKQHFTEGRRFEFTETPTVESDRTDNIVRHKIDRG